MWLHCLPTLGACSADDNPSSSALGSSGGNTAVGGDAAASAAADTTDAAADEKPAKKAKKETKAAKAAAAAAAQKQVEEDAEKSAQQRRCWDAVLSFFAESVSFLGRKPQELFEFIQTVHDGGRSGSGAGAARPQAGGASTAEADTFLAVLGASAARQTPAKGGGAGADAASGRTPGSGGGADAAGSATAGASGLDAMGGTGWVVSPLAVCALRQALKVVKSAKMPSQERAAIASFVSSAWVLLLQAQRRPATLLAAMRHLLLEAAEPQAGASGGTHSGGAAAGAGASLSSPGAAGAVRIPLPVEASAFESLWRFGCDAVARCCGAEDAGSAGGAGAAAAAGGSGTGDRPPKSKRHKSAHEPSGAQEAASSANPPGQTPKEPLSAVLSQQSDLRFAFTAADGAPPAAERSNVSKSAAACAVTAAVDRWPLDAGGWAVLQHQLCCQPAEYAARALQVATKFCLLFLSYGVVC